MPGKLRTKEMENISSKPSWYKRIPNKGFLLICVAIILFPTAARGIRNYIFSQGYQKSVIIIEGENPKESNFYNSTFRTPKSRHYFGGQSLELDTPDPVEGGYFSRYEFTVPEDGDYNIFIAGTPPGPAEKGSEWHSPYSISIDGMDPKSLTEEAVQGEWPYVFKFKYAEGGYYLTKVATEHLNGGRHFISVFINQRRQYDSHFTMYLDALIIAPKNFKPKTNVGKIPRELFSS